MIADALANLFGNWSATTVDLGHPRDPQIAKMFGMGHDVLSGVKVDADKVIGISAVYRGVNIIANAMMKVRPIIYKRLADGGEDDKVRDRNHSAWRFVTRSANPYMSSGYFRKTLTAWSILRGNGLGYVDRDGGGRIIDATPLLPDRSGMAIFRNGQQMPGTTDPQPGDVVSYWTFVGGELRRLDSSNVIHIKGLSNNGYWGLDVVDVLCETFGLSIASRDFSARFFGQGATPSAVVFAPTGLKDTQLKDFTKNLKEANQGLGKSHKLMILEESAKVQQLTVDPEKAQLLGTRQFSLIDIANAIGIQGHKIGDSTRMAYNSLEQSNQSHLDDDLDPLLQAWEDELEEKCLTEPEKKNETHLIEFNRKALVRVNLQARTQRHQFERQNGLATANDIRRQENQQPIGPVGDTFMVPANMTILAPDGLPIITGQAGPPEPRRGSAPAGDDDESAHRLAFEELALHEVERFARRTTSEAVRQAKKGDAAFLTFLDELNRWQPRPAAVAEILESVRMSAWGTFNTLTAAPYAAAELAANVEAAAETLISEALELARHQLEQTR